MTSAATIEAGRVHRPRSLYALKPWYTRVLTPVLEIADRARISPDLVTVLGVGAAAAAGVALALGSWPAAAVLLALRLAGANLDGALARRRGVQRPWGFVLNELGDRASDLLMFGGLAILIWRLDDGPGVVAVLVAALAATLPTVAALALAGAGAARPNGGPVGKTERCLLAVLIAAFPGATVVLAGLIVIGSLATAALRLVQGHRALSRESSC